MFKLEVRPGLFQIPIDAVKVYYLDGGADGGVLIDAGTPGSAKKILGNLGMHGFTPGDVSHILVTHLHSDHTGALAELQRTTGARVCMHRSDAALIEEGRAYRRLVPSPGLMNRLLWRTVIRTAPQAVEPAAVDIELRDGDVLPLCGGIEVVHTPGHSEGHVCFLWRAGRTLFVGDAAHRLWGLSEMVAYENRRQGIHSLERLARLDFDVACFGHGEPLTRRAAAQFRKKWG